MVPPPAIFFFPTLLQLRSHPLDPSHCLSLAVPLVASADLWGRVWGYT